MSHHEQHPRHEAQSAGAELVTVRITSKRRNKSGRFITRDVTTLFPERLALGKEARDSQIIDVQAVGTLSRSSIYRQGAPTRVSRPVCEEWCERHALWVRHWACRYHNEAMIQAYIARLKTTHPNTRLRIGHTDTETDDGIETVQEHKRRIRRG